MIFVTSIIWIATLLLAFYACFPALSLLGAYLCKRREPLPVHAEMSFGCIITANCDLRIAFPQIDSILKQNYSNFRIYLVADRCERPDILPEHSSLSILFPDTPLNSKALSIKYAMDRFVCEPDAILILDSDNLLHANTLGYLNNYLTIGYIAVQGQKTAKNLSTTLSALEAMRELYYNTIQRDIPFIIGSSATIAGSGIAVKTWYFRLYIDQLFNKGKQYETATEKLLQIILVERGHRIAYCRKALIFDEKVTPDSQAQRQHTNWIQSWFNHWKSAMGLAFMGMIKRDWNIFYFGIMLSFPPVSILLGGLLLAIFLGALINTAIMTIGLTGLFVYILQFFVSLTVSNTPLAIWKAVPQIPVFIWRQFLAGMKIQGSRKDFIATDHTQHMDIENVWQRRRGDFPYVKQEVTGA